LLDQSLLLELDMFASSLLWLTTTIARGKFKHSNIKVMLKKLFIIWSIRLKRNRTSKFKHYGLIEAENIASHALIVGQGSVEL
jgi:hypothetical protein